MGPGQDHRGRPRAVARPRVQPLSATPYSRRIEVSPERFERWLSGFAERHGQTTLTREQTPTGELVRARADDGASLIATPFCGRPMAVILIRRGGYAVACVDDSRIVAAKVGTRHVQSRTAAGGWSQQRFARRRANQADALVGAVTDHANRILLTEAADANARPGLLLLGGDRALAASVLEDPRLRAIRGLPRRELYDLPDPCRAVLDTAIARGRSVWVELTEPEIS